MVKFVWLFLAIFAIAATVHAFPGPHPEAPVTRPGAAVPQQRAPTSDLKSENSYGLGYWGGYGGWGNGGWGGYGGGWGNGWGYGGGFGYGFPYGYAAAYPYGPWGGYGFFR